MRNILLGLTGAVVLTACILVGRALLLPDPEQTAATLRGFNVYDGEAIAARLSRAIQIETVSFDTQTMPDAGAFGAFADFLRETYPAAHVAMTRETVGGHSLLYKWPGAGTERKPVGLIAHIDVVPVEGGTEGLWTHPAFSGALSNGAVWGRGAMDNKGQLIAIMEAVERLAADGFKPSRDIYLLFGHDEELGGFSGAGEIAKLLKERDVYFEWTLDEGSGLVQDIIPGVASPVALISTGEKGSTTLRFTATAPGGHSSAPGKDTAVSIASRAVIAVTDNPYPLIIDDSMVAFLHAIASELPFAQRLALANLWLTGPMVKAQLGADPATAAALHTTTAATIIEGGAKVNVLPQQTSVLVNYRIHPRDNVSAVRERAIQLINDERVTVEAVGGREPSPAASTRSDGYNAIAKATATVFGPVPTAPFLTLQGTDTRHYIDLADDNYRFTPFIYHSDDLARIHGNDERVLIEDLARGAAFYETLLRETAEVH
ncbi:M20/M25/M40 family metallo-hydrolase [Hyphococcus sp.]|uniref:M20/M25/M40 family metallo-hydrolase n=1 Tax=Hyphococcus sp. TaxID=2038636 RepID=UPI00207FACE0|nr:MAG: carboxypeptidase S [Marinicaulis sp.]